MNFFNRFFKKNYKKEEPTPPIVSKNDSGLFSNCIKSSDFKKLVSKEIGPFLRKNGWKGSGYDYTRKKYGVLNKIKFQGSSGGRKFCINLNTTVQLQPSFENQLINERNEWNFSDRLSPHQNHEHWWDFPERNTDYTPLMNELKSVFENYGDDTFKIWDNWEETTLSLDESTLNSDFFETLFYGTTDIMKLMFCATHSIYSNKFEKAKELSLLGIEKIKEHVRGEGAVPIFQEIIKVADESAIHFRLSAIEKYFQNYSEFSKELSAAQRINAIALNTNVKTNDLISIVDLYNETNSKIHVRGSGWIDFSWAIGALLSFKGVSYTIKSDKSIQITSTDS
ncbi:MAG: DUF4304 domain-containing protein [Saprospiraceae bacterium]|nr:DUF4304 domain-containing protein [Saprospiraceae bacterium]